MVSKLGGEMAEVFLTMIEENCRCGAEFKAQGPDHFGQEIPDNRT